MLCRHVRQPRLLHPGGVDQNFNGNFVQWLFYLCPIRLYVRHQVMYLGILEQGPGDSMTILLVMVHQ